MQSAIILLTSMEYGLERWKIKIVKRFNMKSGEIRPKITRKSGDLTCLYVGRNVSERKVRDYLVDYLHNAGLYSSVIRMRLL